MQLKTILNRVEPHKSFVYRRICWTGDGIQVDLEPRSNGRVHCSSCRCPAPLYDRLPATRRFEFVPLWGIAVFFVYRMRRVNCRTCGVRVEWIPWSTGKQHLTNSYRWFLASWARRLSWQEVAEVFRTTWQNVFRAVKHAVFWGVVHNDLEGIQAIGIDEIQWQRGHRYLTLVYQIEDGLKRLLCVIPERTEAALEGFFEVLSDECRSGIRYVCSDMWRPYLAVIARQAGSALHILDRYHIVARLNKAIDKVRAAEARRMQQDGYEPILKHSRWCFLKRPENLTDRQTVKLSEVLQYNLRTVRAYLHARELDRFWEYRQAHWAGRFLDEWCTRVMRSRLEPLKGVARSLRGHRELLLNWFRARGTISAGIVEGFNNKAKLTMRKAYGFRTYGAIEVALLHNLGKLPEPEFTHRFW